MRDNYERKLRDEGNLSADFLDSQGNVTKAGLQVAGTCPQQFYSKLFIDMAVYAGTRKGTAESLRFMDRTICEG